LDRTVPAVFNCPQSDPSPASFSILLASTLFTRQYNSRSTRTLNRPRSVNRLNRLLCLRLAKTGATMPMRFP
jgi:hypothetical protein